VRVERSQALDSCANVVSCDLELLPRSHLAKERRRCQLRVELGERMLPAGSTNSASIIGNS